MNMKFTQMLLLLEPRLPLMHVMKQRKNGSNSSICVNYALISSQQVVAELTSTENSSVIMM